jgi:hypothetical protein
MTSTDSCFLRGTWAYGCGMGGILCFWYLTLSATAAVSYWPIVGVVSFSLETVLKILNLERDAWFFCPFISCSLNSFSTVIIDCLTFSESLNSGLGSGFYCGLDGRLFLVSLRALSCPSLEISLPSLSLSWLKGTK